MDVLVAVGTTASYGDALWATLMGTDSMEYHFFEAPIGLRVEPTGGGWSGVVGVCGVGLFLLGVWCCV